MPKKQDRQTGPGARGGALQRVRIIGGQWKRTPLSVIAAEGLRPTPDRVRETVFNWLGHLMDGRWQQVNCLDPFAGSGALGFEAASRGAASVVMIESNGAAARQLQATVDKLGAGQVRILRGDALAAMRKLAADAEQGRRFDLIFLDPPYHQDWLMRLLPLCQVLLADGGLVYAEAESALDPATGPDWLEGWNTVRSDKAGMVFYHLLQRNKNTDFQA